jgi:hypothetical protein
MLGLPQLPICTKRVSRQSTMRTFSPGGARPELQVAGVTYPARLCSSAFVTSATWLVLSQPQEWRVVWRGVLGILSEKLAFCGGGVWV